MLYVLLSLVVALALVSGAEYAMIKVYNAEYRAEIAKLRGKNSELENKVCELSRINSIKEGIN